MYKLSILLLESVTEGVSKLKGELVNLSRDMNKVEDMKARLDHCIRISDGILQEIRKAEVIKQWISGIYCCVKFYTECVHLYTYISVVASEMKLCTAIAYELYHFKGSRMTCNMHNEVVNILLCWRCSYHIEK